MNSSGARLTTCVSPLLGAHLYLGFIAIGAIAMIFTTGVPGASMTTKNNRLALFISRFIIIALNIDVNLKMLLSVTGPFTHGWNTKSISASASSLSCIKNWNFHLTLELLASYLSSERQQNEHMHSDAHFWILNCMNLFSRSQMSTQVRKFQHSILMRNTRHRKGINASFAKYGRRNTHHNRHLVAAVANRVF